MVRKIPANIRSKGELIANSPENINIIAIYSSSKLVVAQINAADLFEVSLSEIDASFDECGCLLFTEKGYCEHIAAIEIYFRNLNLPLNRLFNVPRQEIEHKFIIDELSPELQEIIALYPPAYLILNEAGNKKNKQEIANLPQKTQTEAENLIENLGVYDSESLFYQTDLVNISFELTIQKYQLSNEWDDFENRLFIGFKIGKRECKKKYVVKNYREMFDSIENRKVFYTAGKENYHLGWESFDSSTAAILEELSKISVPVILNRSFQQNADRYLVIPKEKLELILKLIIEQGNYTFSNQLNRWADKKSYSQIFVENMTIDYSPFLAEFKEQENGYVLTFEAQNELELAESQILIWENMFFMLNAEQFIAYQKIMKAFVNIDVSTSSKKRESKFDFPKDNTTVLHFKKNEIAELNVVVELLQIICKIELPKHLRIEKMVPIFAFSKKNRRLAVDVIFEYNQKEYKGYQSLEKLGSLRQLKAENFVFSVLQRLNYQIIDFQAFKEYPSHQALVAFFMEELPLLKKIGELRLSEDLQEVSNSIKSLKHQILVKQSKGLLSVNFVIDGIDETEIDQLLNHLEHQERYFESKDGRLFTLDDEELTRIAMTLKGLRKQAKLNHGEFFVRSNQAIVLEQALEGYNSVAFDQKIKQMTHDLTHPEQFEINLPQNLNAELRPYQVKGVQFLSVLDYHGFGGILADEMGLGKTLQMITFLLGKVSVEHPSLIICPASLIYNWQEEFHRFAPDLNVLVVDGIKKMRQASIAKSVDVYITSYQSARIDLAEYKSKQISYLVLDEAQFVKNSQTKINQALRELLPKNVFALSGTPIENRLEELWAIMSIVMPGLFPSKKEFKLLSTPQVSQMVAPFILRREKATVLTELPDKIEKNIYNELHESQKVVYLAQLKQMQVRIQGMSSDVFVKNKLEILTGLTRLRQICDTPALFLDDYHGKSGKIEQLKEILARIHASGSRPLIFSQFTSMLDIVEKEVSKLGLSSFKLTGQVKAKKRLEMVEAFNDGKQDVFLISLKAGGTGLNLTGADTVILLDLWWNPAVEDQATARAHRFGQNQNVEVIRLITKGTIEEEIYKLQAQKRDLIDQVLSGAEQKATLTETEIKQILGLKTNG